MKKQVGVLCHVTSIPSDYGVGDFGRSSFEFIDFLAENNIQIWQILPLNETKMSTTALMPQHAIFLMKNALSIQKLY